MDLNGLKLRKLTNSQKDILHLYSDEFLTIKQIAQRKNCSIQYIYRIIKLLKKRGEIDIGLNKVENFQSTSITDVRLHGQEMNIHLLSTSAKYQKQLNKSNVLILDLNTIRLYKTSIEIYFGQSFYGKTINEADKNSLNYMIRFLNRLSHDLDIELIKPRARNIKIVNQHYARGDSEIADNSIKNRERVWVYAEEDGKLCFITDNSFGFREDETLHPITAKIDRKAVDKQVNDWRLHNPPTNSELAQISKETAHSVEILSNTMGTSLKELPIVIDGLKKQISSHLKLIKEYRKENKLWRKNFEREYKKKEKEQTKLSKWM